MSEIFEKEQMAEFLDRFATFEQQIVQTRIDTDIASFKRLFEAFAPVDKQLQELLLTTAPGYNIFNILNISHYEARVHTPFLAHLLTPKASHNQDRLFFDSFIDAVFGKGYSDAIHNIEIHEEFNCAGLGRIDILILYRMGGQKKAIVIENKIYHHDEEKQLERYYQYLTQVIQLPTRSYHLIYLTPHKTLPTEYSISKALYKKLIGENSLTTLGYRQDIVPWLRQILPAVKACNVKETLLQYIKTIQAL